MTFPSNGDVSRSEDEAHDRLTRLTKLATEAIEGSPEYGDEKMILFLLNDGGEAGIAVVGFDSDAEALYYAIAGVRAMFRAAGKDFGMMPMPGAG